MIRVLVTSVGGGVGQSIVDSLSQLNEMYYIVGLDISEHVYSRSQCNEFKLSKKITDPVYLQFLLDKCLESKIDILIPGNDGELVLLSENINKFSELGIKVVVCPTKIVKSSRNKFRWFEDYRHIINIVPTIALSDYAQSKNINDITFPAIAKPASGSASAGIKIYLSRSEVLDDISNISNANEYVIQPYLFPSTSDVDYKPLVEAVKSRVLLQASEISCQIIYSVDSEVLGIFISKNSLKNGIPIKIEPLNDLDIYNVVLDIANKLKSENVVGPVNLQGRLTNIGLVFFEMNLRFTGITGNRSQFGFNEVASTIESFVSNKNIPLIDSNKNRVGARQVACSTFYPLDKKLITSILVTGASSWAAKNFIHYFHKCGYLDNKTIYLSTRSSLALKKEFDNTYDSKYKFVYLGTSQLELSTALSSCDAVLNFASARPPCPNMDVLNSTTFNLNLAALISKSNIGLVINMSSQSVYKRNTHEILTENGEIDVQSYYSFSKLLVEQAFLNCSPSTSIINFRLSRLWGGELALPTSQLPSRMIDSVYGGDEVVLNNSSNQLNLIDIDDVSAFTINVFNLWELGGYLPKTINVSNQNISILDLRNSLLACIETKTELNRLKLIEKKSSDDSLLLSNRQAVQLGFRSKNTLEDTWKKMIASYIRSKK